MQTFSKAFSVVVNVLTGFIAIVALVILIMYAAGVKPAVVLSGSMEPTVETGSVAFINTKDRNVGIGDVVQYRIVQDNGEMKVLHRIIDIRDDGTFVTKGDNNDTEDMNPVGIDQINGKYLMRIPGIGHIIETPLYIIVFFSVLIGVHVLAWLLSVLAEDDDDEPRRKRFSLG